MSNRNILNKWLNFVENLEPSIYQSVEWAIIKQKEGKKPIIISYVENDKLRASVLAFENIITTPFGRKKILVAQGNPSFVTREDGIKILQKFKEFSNKNYFYGTIAPTVVNPCPEIFLAAGYRKISNYTILIDLNKTEEELWKSLEKKSARWGVKAAEKNNLKFELAKKHEIDSFYLLYKKTAKRGGFIPEQKNFLIKLRNTDISKLFLIKKDNKIVAGGLILIDRNYNYSILNLTASSNEGNKLQAMPFLYWKLIIYSKSLGLNYFDLGGYDMEARPAEKTYNINKFKERFGGTIVEQPIYSTNWKYSFLRKLARKIRLIKKLYKKK